MEYHADRDSYICRNGRELTVTNERRSKTAGGYVSVKTYYRSPDCTGCPYKTECIKGNNCKTPMEKRNRVLMVSKTMSQKRAEDLERITSEYGTMLRMNRSIQAEGSFADVKEDMNFRRYLYRGKANALAESILLAMGRNINKLHCKIQTGRTGSHLFSLKTAQILMVENKTVLNQACRKGCLGMNCVYKGWGEITTDFSPIWA